MTLTAGSNTVKFANSAAYAPNIDRIQVAPAVGAGGTSYLKLQNRSTGLYVDGVGRTADGSAVGQWTGGSTTNQEWSIVPDGSWIRLRNRATGLYLDGLGLTANGSTAGQWSGSTSANQQFRIVLQ
ncbi:RICIN domain-containing protein [Streptomyces sp. NPDC002680]|uniref:RICIN domain-containing protein n=1 Tax=Streptomyces sp. NPDC002680 TaxID=3364659 RepID=UPI0036B202F5